MKRREFLGLSSMRLLRISAVMTLLAIALMVWALLAPTPLPVMLAMTAGQGLGTGALALFGWVVLRERRGKGASEATPPPEKRE